MWNWPLWRAWIDRSRQMQEGQVCYIEAEAVWAKPGCKRRLLLMAQPGVTCLIGKCELHRNNISFWAFSNMLATRRTSRDPGQRRLKIVLGLLPPDQQDEVMLQSLSQPTCAKSYLADCANSFCKKLLSDPFY